MASTGEDILDADLAYLMKEGIAVLAEHPWAALQGRRVLKIEWDGGIPMMCLSPTIALGDRRGYVMSEKLTLMGRP